MQWNVRLLAQKCLPDRSQAGLRLNNNLNLTNSHYQKCWIYHPAFFWINYLVTRGKFAIINVTYYGGYLWEGKRSGRERRRHVTLRSALRKRKSMRQKQSLQKEGFCFIPGHFEIIINGGNKLDKIKSFFFEKVFTWLLIIFLALSTSGCALLSTALSAAAAYGIYQATQK